MLLSAFDDGAKPDEEPSDEGDNDNFEGVAFLGHGLSAGLEIRVVIADMCPYCGLKFINSAAKEIDMGLNIMDSWLYPGLSLSIPFSSALRDEGLSRGIRAARCSLSGALARSGVSFKALPIWQSMRASTRSALLRRPLARAYFLACRGLTRV